MKSHFKTLIFAILKSITMLNSYIYIVSYEKKEYWTEVFSLSSTVALLNRREKKLSRLELFP